MSDTHFPRENRVRSRGDFRRVYQRRCSVADDLLLVRGCENGLDQSRLGLAVSRRVGSAVVRNRWKRTIREAFRLMQSRLPAGIDLVVAPRKPASPTLDELRSSLSQLAKRLARKLNRPQR
jgi:ribonuclease P protein component